MAATLRIAIAGAVLVLLARAGRAAWRHRGIAVAVWRRIRPRHVLGALGLVVVLVSVAGALLQVVPVTRYGAGSLIGLHGNAVFAPVEEAAVMTASARDGGGAAAAEVAFTLGATAFLLLLLTLFPWLAYVEERTFRAGLEHAGPLGEAWAALRFGLLHLVMLIPLAAALSIAVAGFAYGRVYRRAYRQALAEAMPRATSTPDHRAAGATRATPAPAAVPPAARAQSEAVLASTVWHTTCNSVIVVLLLLGLLAGQLLG